MSMNKREIIRLAKELLSAIDGGGVALDLLVVKALSLARATSDIEATEWLSCEMTGYDSSKAVGRRYAILTARWDGTSETGYFGSAAAIASTVGTMSQTLDTYKKFEPSGQHALAQLSEKARRVNEWATSIQPLEKVVSAIRVQLHFFGARVLMEAQFSETSRSIFERFQSAVDATLASQAGKVFEKLPYVFER